jgi:hypothetical protein
MRPSPTFKIESFNLDQKYLKAYALAFKEAVSNWQNILGDPIYMTQKKWEEDAEKLIKAISNASPSNCIALLKKYGATPEKLFRITELSSGASESLPIYTGIRQVSLEGQGSILAEAFFGAELHLLDAAGRLLSIYDYRFPPELGFGQMYLIDCNDDYDSLVGRIPDPTFVEIIGYAPENIIRNFSFPSKKGKIYRVGCRSCDEIQIFTGTGDSITVNNLKQLDAYHLERQADAEDGSIGSWVYIDTHHVGLEWKNIRDFTIQYNTFPFLNERDHWVMQADALSAEDWCKIFAEGWQDRELIEKYLEEDPFSFQFMPPEIRGNRAWVKAFCLREPGNYQFVETSLHNDREFAIELIKSAGNDTRTIYPYLHESLRKDVDILIVMKETENLFHFPEPREVGESKFNDIREFISNNRSRIYEVLELFPSVLHYAPEDMLSDRQLLLHALPNDNELVAILPESYRDDPEIILAAANHNNALRNASDRLKSDREFVKKMISINGAHINYAGPFRFDKEMIKSAFYKSRIRDLSEDILNKYSADKEIMLLFLRDNSYGLEKIHTTLRQNKEFVLAAIKECSISFNLIEEPLRSDKEIILAAIHQRLYGFADIFNHIFHNSLKNVPAVFFDDKEIANAIITTIDKENLEKFFNIWSEVIKSDSDLMKKAVLKSYQCFAYISESLKNDKSFLLKILPHSPKCFHYLSESMKSDPDIFGSIDIFKI